MTIVPAIIPESREHIFSSLARLSDVAESVQIDLVDGKYAGKPCWPWNSGADFSEVTAAVVELSKTWEVEVDLMVEKPEQYAEALIAAGAARLVIHLGSTEKLHELLSLNSGTRMGLGLMNDKSLSELFTYANEIDFVQCMGIAEIGVQGNGFDDRVLARIRDIHIAHPGLPISVDGSVNIFTLPLLKDAGATRFVAGSAIFGTDDPQRAFVNLQSLADA